MTCSFLNPRKMRLTLLRVDIPQKPAISSFVIFKSIKIPSRTFYPNIETK